MKKGRRAQRDRKIPGDFGVTPVPPRGTVLLGSRRGSHLFIIIVLFFTVVSVKCVKDGGKFACPDMYSLKQTSYMFE